MKRRKSGSLQRELEELEQSDPSVKLATDKYDRAVRQILDRTKRPPDAVVNPRRMTRKVRVRLDFVLLCDCDRVSIPHFDSRLLVDAIAAWATVLHLNETGVDEILPGARIDMSLDYRKGAV